MGILTCETRPVNYPHASEPGFAYSYTVYHDRRRLEAFQQFHVPRFQHVTSCKTQAQAYNMLHGRLCHLMRIVMDGSCFVLEAARCIHHMRRSGYDANCCFTHTERFLYRFRREAYNMPCLRLFDEIRACYHRIASDDRLNMGRADEWTPVHYTIVVPRPPARYVDPTDIPPAVPAAGRDVDGTDSDMEID